MIGTSAKLQALGFEDLEDFRVRADENGEHIEWYSQSPQPTQAQLDAVTDQQATAALENKRIRRSFELSKKDQVLIKWIAQRTGGGTAEQIRAELLNIWQNTN